MSALTAVVFAMWVLPIVGVGIAYARLSRRVTRELAAFTADRAVTDPAEARRLIQVKHPAMFDIPVPADQKDSLPAWVELRASSSGRVDVRALNERRLFALSTN